ncbi:hypothetical protein [Saccharopolyspora sp. CA-218241]|uniref:hypothetical protein n=1 Tax=Saccharopolyspora sp. CA-218241 TaxID=3240027 RepID=UPI003D96B9C6
MPGTVSGGGWAGCYDELAQSFALGSNRTGPDFGMESMVDTIAGPGVAAHLRRRADAGRLVRTPVVDPVPLHPWSVGWRSGNRHPGLPDPAAPW